MPARIVRAALAAVMVGASALCAAPTATAGELPVGPVRAISTGVGELFTVHAADIDADGDLDVFTASASDNTIAWFENLGGQPPLFSERRVISPATIGAIDVHTADINQDGRLDVVTAGRDEFVGEFAWHENLGGTPVGFGARQVVWDGGDGPRSVRAFDADEDGDIDVLTTSFIDDEVMWQENLGGSPIQWQFQFITFDPDGRGGFFDGTASGPQRAITADINRDGALDIVTASAQDDKIQWWRQDREQLDPGFRFPPNRLISTQTDSPADIGVGDLDDDGDTDVLAVTTGNAWVAWWENINNYNPPVEERLIGLNALSPRSLDVGDLDLDGDLDVVVGMFGANSLMWYENLGGSPPAFAQRVLAAGIDRPLDVSLADLDNDGDLDILYAALLDARSAGWIENRTLHASSFFAAGEAVANASAQSSVLLPADIDRDGGEDFVVLSSSDGAISWRRNMRQTPPLFEERAIASAPAGLSGGRVVDLERNAIQDILITSPPQGKVLLYTNLATSPPSFLPAVELAATPGATAAADCDLDKDTDPELVVVSTSNNDAHLFIQRDTLSGVFETFAGPPIAGAGGRMVECADVNSDTMNDIVSARAAGASSVIQLARQTSTAPIQFAVTQAAAFDGAIQSLALTDIDGDSNLDIVAVVQGVGEVIAFMNNGGAAPVFTRRTLATGLSAPTRLDASDIDRDGDTDLAIATSTGAAVLENLGGSPPVFALRPVEASTGNLGSLLLTDVNDDGAADLVTGDASSNLLVHLNGRAQFGLTATDIAPATGADGSAVAALRINFDHLGRVGDPAVELRSVKLRLETAGGSPLNPTQANALLARFSLFRDDGSGAFEPAADTEIAFDTSLAPIDGEVALIPNIGDAGAQVLPGSDATLFVVAALSANASGQALSAFRVKHVGQDSAANTEDGAPLAEHAVEPTTSSVITAVPSVDTCPWDFNDSGKVDPVDLAFLLSNWRNPFGPVALAALLVDWGDCP